MVSGDVPWSIRFRWFDQYLVDAERDAVLAGVADEVAALAADPDAPDRGERIAALVILPTVGFLADRLAAGVQAEEPMLRVPIRSTAGDFDLTCLSSLSVDGRAAATGDYRLEGRPTRVVSTLTRRRAGRRRPDRDEHRPARRSRRRGRGRGRVVPFLARRPRSIRSAGPPEEVFGWSLGWNRPPHRGRRLATTVCRAT